jgi:hypothetical protein
VLDRQSNPAAAAAVTYVDPTGAVVVGLQRWDFLIGITIDIPATLCFFAGRSFAGHFPGEQLRIDNTYLVSTTPDVTMMPADARLVAEVRRVRAAGANPVYSFTRIPKA